MHREQQNAEKIIIRQDFVMLNSFQHLVMLTAYQTLKQVQGDINRVFQGGLIAMDVHSLSLVH